MAKKKKLNTYFPENIEKIVTKKAYDEVKTAERNQSDTYEDFEKIIDMTTLLDR